MKCDKPQHSEDVKKRQHTNEGWEHMLCSRSTATSIDYRVLTELYATVSRYDN